MLIIIFAYKWFYKKELIGSTHNIVNHPDTPKSYLKDVASNKVMEKFVNN